MNKVIFIALLFLTGLAKAQSYSGPESVEYDYVNARWLIANTGSHQVLSRSGTGTLSVFATLTGSGPYGIEIVGDTLYCCNGSSIKGFSLTTGLQGFNVTTAASFLNGITQDNNGNLYATDFNGLKIYKINIATQTATVVASNLVQKPNGIIYDDSNSRCIFVNWGTNAPIKAMNINTFAVTTIVTTTLSNCDGIAFDGQGNYYVSNWGSSSIKKYNNTFTGTPVTVASGLSSPADIFYNVVGDTLASPNSGNNTVTFIGFTGTAIDEHLNENNLSVTPNPVKETATIEFNIEIPSMISIELTDINGKLICEVYNSIQKEKSNAIQLNRENLKTGIYFLKFYADDKTITQKVIFE